MSEHKYIWLQPECCADPDEGRHWCQDPDPVECDDGKPWVKYILASEHEALERQLADVREPMCAVCAGDKEAAKRINCICDGIGTQWGELEGMRGELQKTIAELESATAELTTLRQSLQRAEGERNEALGLLSVAKCPNCDGGGATIGVTNHTIPRCCGRFLPTGECCGQAEPECVPEQYLEQCEWCARKSGLLPLPASDGGGE